MISKSEIEKALDVRIPVSVEMEIALDDWVAAYEKKSYWIKDDVVSLSLPAIVAKETARLILTGGKSWVSGSARADYVQQQYQNYMKNARKDVEYGCALGGIILKPFLSGTEVKVDAICADRFFPISFDSDGYITDAVFIEQLTRSDKYYTRVERHSLDLKTKVYSVDNLAFVSSSPELMGSSCSLEAVPEWADYTEHVQIENCERPLFAYFKVPGANNIDRRSPTGISVYANSIEEFRQADEHWALIQWEFDGSQLAIDAPEDIFRKKEGKLLVPKRMQRLFRTSNYDVQKDMPIKEFSPAIRDVSLFNGLNRIFQRIEFNCGLSYGTISDPQTVEKTAEEVRSGRERSRSNIKDIQAALEDALEHLIWIIDRYADLYSLAPAGECDTLFEWGEGVTEDRDKEYTRRLQMVTSGLLSKEKFLAWYFGCTEDEAKEYLPQSEDLFNGGGT